MAAAVNEEGGGSVSAACRRQKAAGQQQDNWLLQATCWASKPPLHALHPPGRSCRCWQLPQPLAAARQVGEVHPAALPKRKKQLACWAAPPHLGPLHCCHHLLLPQLPGWWHCLLSLAAGWLCDQVLLHCLLWMVAGSWGRRPALLLPPWRCQRCRQYGAPVRQLALPP